MYENSIKKHLTNVKRNIFLGIWVTIYQYSISKRFSGGCDKLHH